ncbi:TetR/AcrR family transcriptional regulator [Peribacillus simplex]|uniref:TetR/AcrR family transcriptional regulator n=2 Tax=Peribacillus TaxID=2675229 RepID=A0AA90PIJ2_9BACI|nr:MULTISPECIES: TetR/AcrR family transcriptional regulator [Peribacillus]MDP1421542.1 TetR/AcrR family transcriptional regulator [Peribacillus simplex]MDP1454307.1 TetR/AcrR family transcriptional regulator [Peribacillus frigoritolerans]
MKEKNKMIIDKSVELFAEKGYHATSVQEIAEKCGIAKGSFYNYFKSKEELLVSIFKFYYEALTDSLLDLELDASLTSKDKFMRQITVHIEHMTGNTNLIQMMMQEQMVHISKELDGFLHYIHEEGLIWFKRKIIELYPGLSADLLPDCTIILDSLFKGYIGILIRKQNAFDVELLPSFILNRMDSIIESLQSMEDPLLKQFPLPGCSMRDMSPKEEIHSIIVRMLEVETRKEEGMEKRKNTEALKAIQEEFSKVRPSPIILESLLLFLEKNEKRSPLCSKLILVMKDYLTNI